MVQIVQTELFSSWLAGLADRRAVQKIAVRVRRMELGNAGDVKSVGEGVSEIRIDHGPGYRMYFTRKGKTFVILLCGGDKKSQRRDIKAAQQMAKEV